tara:strand:+ start:1771 stop:1929 length:159 start_codon:yes stop_codon:yes gene_type:complete
MFDDEYIEARSSFIIEELSKMQKSQIIDMIIKYSSHTYLEALTDALRVKNVG